MNICDIQKILTGASADTESGPLIAFVGAHTFLICFSTDNEIRHSLLRRLASSSFFGISEYATLTKSNHIPLVIHCADIIADEIRSNFLFEFNIEDADRAILIQKHPILPLPHYHACPDDKK